MKKALDCQDEDGGRKNESRVTHGCTRGQEGSEHFVFVGLRELSSSGWPGCVKSCEFPLMLQRGYSPELRENIRLYIYAEGTQKEIVVA